VCIWERLLVARVAASVGWLAQLRNCVVRARADEASASRRMGRPRPRQTHAWLPPRARMRPHAATDDAPAPDAAGAAAMGAREHLRDADGQLHAGDPLHRLAQQALPCVLADLRGEAERTRRGQQSTLGVRARAARSAPCVHAANRRDPVAALLMPDELIRAL
jgi:hypothetical protein